MRFRTVTATVAAALVVGAGVTGATTQAFAGGPSSGPQVSPHVTSTDLEPTETSLDCPDGDVSSGLNVTAHITSSGEPLTSGYVGFYLDNAFNSPQEEINDGSASHTYNTLSPGEHTIYASYEGDGETYSPSSSNQCEFTVPGGDGGGQSDSGLYLSCPEDLLTIGQPAEIDALFDTDGTPTGSVDFSTSDDADASYTTPVTIQNGEADNEFTFHEPGTYGIAASYGGDANFASSNTYCDVYVSSTTTDLTSSVNPSQVGQQVAFTATTTFYSGYTYPEGTARPDNSRAVSHDDQSNCNTDENDDWDYYIDYYVDGNFAAECELMPDSPPFQTAARPAAAARPHPQEQQTATKTAVWDTSDLTEGSHTITADYYGEEEDFSSDSITQVVNATGPPPTTPPTTKRPTVTTVTSSKNPAAPGSALTFTAKVAPKDGQPGTPTGSVGFIIDGTIEPLVPLGGDDTATFTDGSLGSGSHTIVAGYSGDAVFEGSSGAMNEQVTTPTSNQRLLLFSEPALDNVGEITTTGHWSDSSVASNSRPSSLAIGPDARLWFTEPGTDAIGALSGSGVESDYPLPAGSDPTSIVAGPDGQLWFTEAGRDRVASMTTRGVVTTYRLADGSQPATIAVGPDRKLWFTERGTGAIGRINPRNARLREFSIGRRGVHPFGISRGPGGLWFTERNKRRVGEIDVHGALTDYKVARHSKPTGIVAGPDGRIWYTEPGIDKIGVITVNGDYGSVTIRNGSAPSSITVGPDGRIWFTEPGVSRLGAMTVHGTYVDYPVRAHSAPSAVVGLP